MKRKKYPKKPGKLTSEEMEAVYSAGSSRQLLKILKWVSFGLMMACGVVLSLKALHEPDIWWMLRTGEWILVHGKVPQTDVFSYTFQGTEWINVKWGFEVLLTVFYKIGGAELLMMLQVIATVLILYFLYKTYLLFRKPLSVRKHNIPGIGIILALLVTLVTIAFRLNGRPEMVSHTMTAVFLFLLLRYRLKHTKWIYLVIPLQVIWANMHEAYGTGIIMLVVFTVSCWLEYFYARRTYDYLPVHVPKHLSLATLAAIPAMGIHPYGLRMIWHPVEIFFQLGENKFTTELDNFLSSNYWQAEAYIAIGVFLSSILALFYRYHALPKKMKWYNRPIKIFGLGYVAFLLMFYFLSLTAYRNIPFFIIAATPLLAVGLEKWYHRLIASKGTRSSKLFRRRLYVYSGLSLLGLVFYVLVVTDTFYRNFEDNERYGLRVETLKNPVQAAEFIKEHNITGRAYSDYLTSSYLLHSLQPEFQTYIDLRDLDIFPMSFFERFAETTVNPRKFEAEDSIYQFDYVVLYRPEFIPLHKYLVSSPDYHLVFVDPVAAVYVKEQQAFEVLIGEYSFEQSGRDVFSKAHEPHVSTLAGVINRLFWPLYDGAGYEVYNQDYAAAHFYYELGAFNMALTYAQNAVLSERQKALSYELMGHIQLSLASQGTAGQQQEQFVLSAMQSYNTARELDPGIAGASQGLGLIYLHSGNINSAIAQYEQCLDADPKNLNCMLEMAQAYGQLANAYPGNFEYREKQNDYLLMADETNPNNPFIMAQIGLAYCEMNDCARAVNYLERVEQFQGLDPQVARSVKRCLTDCRG